MAARRVLGAVALAAFVAACSKTATNDLATTAAPVPSEGASSTMPPSTAAPTGWSAEDEQKAATILANGIRDSDLANGMSHSDPLDKRIAVGTCAVAKFEKYYPTLSDFMQESFLASNGNPPSNDSLRDLAVLANCESRVGI